MINNTIELNQNNFGKIGSYVMQDDILFKYFTPREAIRFAAKLKLDKSDKEIDELVERLLSDLMLLKAANTLIGDATSKAISGGERKRTAIGVELITDPSLLLLDEPTSGLDSFSALKIVKILKELARKGKTVIATIH